MSPTGEIQKKWKFNKTLWGIVSGGQDGIFVLESSPTNGFREKSMPPAKIKKLIGENWITVVKAKFGDENGELKWPTGFAADEFGNLYVLDTGNFRIAKFNASGEFVKAWGNKQMFKDWPGGSAFISVDKNYVYVAHSENLYRFSHEGKLISNWQEVN